MASALNIGNINFGIEANTKGLQNAIGKISQFQKLIDQTARKQSKGAKDSVKAMMAQEKAIRGALRETLNLRKAMMKAGAPAEQLKALTNQFRVLTTQLTKGKITTKQFERSMQDFKDKMSGSRRELGRFNATVNKGKGGVGKYAILLRDLESSAVLALGPLSGLGARIRSMGAILGRGKGAFSAWAIALAVGAAGAAIALGKLVVAAVTAGAEMKGLQLRFAAATGSMAEGNKQYNFTITLARKLGLEVNTLAKSYARFLAASQGTSIEGKKSQVIFTQVARAAAALKLNAQDVEGVMRAIEQIMSKGTVQAEELRGQLGDRLPGAFRIAASAMGVTTHELNRMLKAGEVLSDEFLPKFAQKLNEAVGKNAEKNLQTLSGAWTLLGTNVKVLLANIDEFTHTSEMATWWTLRFAETADILAGNASVLAERMEGVKVAVERINRTKGIPLELSRNFSKVREKVAESEEELNNFVAAIRRAAMTSNNIDMSLDFFENLRTLSTAKLKLDDYTRLAGELELVLGREVNPTLAAVAQAWAEVGEKTRVAAEEFKRLQSAPKVMKDMALAAKLLDREIEALALGPEVAQAFQDVGKAAFAYEQQLKLTTHSTEVQAKMLEEYIAKLIIVDTLEAKNTATKQALAAAATAAARNSKKIAGAMIDAYQQTERLREGVKALAKGPDSLEYFDKVEEPLIRMRQKMEEANVPIEARILLLKELRLLLEEQFKLTDKWARASQAMAAATVNSFEEMIMKGGDVKEMLKELVRELIRVWLRATTLDALQSNLGGKDGFFQALFSGFANSGGAAAGGSGVSAAGGAMWMGGNSRGGSARLPGSGGSDKVPFFGMGKPGETVSVSRPDQMGGSGFGGGGITINQYNTFENSSPDPAVMIPLLEDNNRKLTGEILDKLDRGSYA